MVASPRQQSSQKALVDKEFHTVTQPAISIFFPAYNDAGTIASMVVAARIAARQLTHDFEILVVNDGSRDHTAEVLGELERIIPELRVVHHTKNRGYGGALRTGFSSASKALIFYTDGDAQYDPRELRALMERMDEGVDFVNGYKMGRSDPLHRVLIGRIYHWTVRLAFGLRLRDVDCDFRLFRKSILDRVELTKSSGVICVELMKKVQDAGFRILEVPVHHYHRAYGKSQFFNFRRVGRTLYDLIRLWVDLVIRRVHLGPRSAPASTEESARDGQSLVS